MSEFENKPIRRGMLSYQLVLDYLKNNTSLANPLSIDEVYNNLKHNENVTKRQQVSDAIKHWYAHRQLRRIREGMPYKYWYEPREGAPIVPVSNQPKPKAATVAASTKGKPEILVTKNSIVINHAKCKITVEFEDES